MGAVKDSYQITVNRLTGDGNGGYWWIAADSNSRAYQVNYAGPGDVVTNTANLFHFNTFLLLLSGMVTNSITLPQVEVNIDVESVAERESLNAQFNLSPAQLNGIASNFDAEALCKLFGVFQLVRRFYQNGNINIAAFSRILIYLGQNRKITREKVAQTTGFLLINGDITQVQYDAFWVQWTNQVGE